MRIRAFAAVVAAVMMVSLVAPAAFANTVPPSVGTVQGTATVGKTRTFCNNNGTSDVGGAGLGLPLVSKAKNAYYKFGGAVNLITAQAPNVILGARLDVCGDLGPILPQVGSIDPVRQKNPPPPPGIGAACGASRGTNGKGKLVGGGITVWLKHLGWASAIGGVLPITGRAYTDATGSADGKPKSNDPAGGSQIVALINARGAAPCATKADMLNPPIGTGKKDPNGTQGARAFDVDGVFAVV